jgi:hypothetical protein
LSIGNNCHSKDTYILKATDENGSEYISSGRLSVLQAQGLEFKPKIKGKNRWKMIFKASESENKQKSYLHILFPNITQKKVTTC